MNNFRVPVGVLLVFKSQVVHRVVLVETTVPHALYNLSGVDVELLVQNLDDRLLNNRVLVLEIDEMGPRWLVGQTELAALQFPQSGTVLGVDEDRSEQLLGFE